MHIRLVYLLLLSLGGSSGQQTSSPLTVRSIKVNLVSTSSQTITPIGIEAIAKALKSSGVSLALEDRFDPAQLYSADDVIRDVYGNRGRKVRVEHSVTHMPPRGVEIAFDVVELCDCK
jgi:hypothetical protein